MAESTAAQLHPVAVTVGETWVRELVRALQTDEREIVGAWPGTLGEARMRIRQALRAHVDPTCLEELARVAIVAARRGWQAVSARDPEA